MSLGISFSSVGSVALNAARWCGRAGVGTAGWGVATTGMFVGYLMGSLCVRGDHLPFESNPKKSDLKWYGIPAGFAALAAGLTSFIAIGLATGGGRTLITANHLKSIGGNGLFRFGDAMMITQCVIDKIGERKDFDDPDLKDNPGVPPRAGYHQGLSRSRRYYPDWVEGGLDGGARDDLGIGVHRYRLPVAAIWFGLRLLDVGFRFVKIPGHSVPFFSTVGKLAIWK